MDDAFRNHKALPRLQLDNPIFKVDDEPAIQNEEELVIVVMFVPMILALHYTEPNHGIVDLAKRLVVPAIRSGGHQRGHVDRAQRRKLDVEIGCVRVAGRLAHNTSFAGFCGSFRKPVLKVPLQRNKPQLLIVRIRPFSLHESREGARRDEQEQKQEHRQERRLRCTSGDKGVENEPERFFVRPTQCRGSEFLKIPRPQHRPDLWFYRLLSC